MTLVVLGANPTVARAADTLPCEIVHLRLTGTADGAAGAPAEGGTGSRSQVHVVDFLDRTALLPFLDEVVRPLGPLAVVSLTELGLEPAALAAQHLGVTGLDPGVVRATRDKYRMRQLLEQRVPHLNPAFARGDDKDAVATLFARYPSVVAKPVDGFGSNAVALLERLDDLPDDRRTPATLLEQFVEGREYSVEALSANGRHAVVGIAQKGTTAGFVEVSHLMPPPSLDERRQLLVENAVAELLDALGVTDGPSHTEVKLDGDKVVVIETHNRLGGDGIADLVRLTTGLDWRAAALGWPLGTDPPRVAPTAPAAATVFFTAPPGRVTAVADPPAPTHGTLVDWDLSVRPGDEVGALRSSADRLGSATLVAESRSDCLAAVGELTAVPVVVTQRDD
ncbi:ATP-grasp domain-containing protein [Streptomyces sp. RKND-216]|uniref:ATP-grasp domain-containing protein n=1 Tax=Streptomyces sp. RKND-216 TaxID=2562581 RepID=UPI00109E33CE|nr:ATP-grasp domain-containing protein [Streptomyces sp. RKND-216]THA24572.1 ATP-grasp domain-containing protein [Streptomyces sp. RKND-216]